MWYDYQPSMFFLKGFFNKTYTILPFIDTKTKRINKKANIIVTYSYVQY